MIYFIYLTIYWIINISYAKFHSNLTKQSYKNTPLKKGALSRNNYLKRVNTFIYSFPLIIYCMEVDKSFLSYVQSVMKQIK